jgi:hypothetical protein
MFWVLVLGFPSLGFILGGRAAALGQQVPHRAYRPIRNDIDFAFSLGFPSLIFLVLILMGRRYGRLRNIHVLSSGGLLFSSSNLEK